MDTLETPCPLTDAQRLVLREVEYSRRQAAACEAQMRQTPPGNAREALGRLVVVHAFHVALGEVWLSDPAYMHIPQGMPAGLGTRRDVGALVEDNTRRETMYARARGQAPPPPRTLLVDVSCAVPNLHWRDGWLTRGMRDVATA